MIAYSILDASGSPVSYISTLSIEFRVKPTDADYLAYSGLRIPLYLKAELTPLHPNTQVQYEIQFPIYRDLVCPLTTLSLQSSPVAQLTFSMPYDGSQNYEVFSLPLLVDSASMTKLGDPTGLAACGDRIYTVVTLTDKIEVDNLMK